MDVTQCKHYAPLGVSRFDFRSLSRLKRTGPELVRDGDMDAVDEKLNLMVIIGRENTWLWSP